METIYKHTTDDGQPVIKRTTRAKHWVFTINNYTPEDEASLKNLWTEGHCSYVVYGYEVGGRRETPHLQGYLMYKITKTFPTVKSHLPRAWLDKKRGTVAQASSYCMKDGNFIEYGELPAEQTGNATEKTKEFWQETKELAQQGELEEIHPKHYIQFYSTLIRIRNDYKNKMIPPNLDWVDGNSPNEWIYGPTGTGKSTRARDKNPGFFTKNCTKWWDDYHDEEVVIIEDVGQSHIWMGDYLKIWADRFGFRGEVKYGARTLRPKRIIVTSNYHPSELWTDRSIVDPLLRRFKLIHLTEKFVHNK